MAAVQNARRASGARATVTGVRRDASVIHTSNPSNPNATAMCTVTMVGLVPVLTTIAPRPASTKIVNAAASVGYRIDLLRRCTTTAATASVTSSVIATAATKRCVHSMIA